jgi:hypothetical protein
MSERERLADALLRRASEAVDAAGAIVAESEVLVEVSGRLRGGMLTTRCAWCGRYRVAGRWVVVVRQERLFESTRTSHGICPDCTKALRDSGMSV